MDKIYTQGLFAHAPKSEKAREFIVASVSIKPSDFIKFLTDNKDKTDKGGYINFELKKSMRDENRFYGQLKEPYNPSTQKVTAKDHSPDREEDLPF